MSTDHLRVHRRLILSRALLSGAAGLLPVPYLDDLIAGQIRSTLVRRIADLRRVDVDANAVHELAEPHHGRLLQAAGTGALLLGGARQIWRKVAASILVVRRVDEAVQTFQVGTLFDHYCARHHLGLGLDGRRARALREAMEEAVKNARSRAFYDALSRAVGQARTFAERLSRRRLVEQIERELDAPASVYTAALLGAFDVAWAPRKQGYLPEPK
jgi:uncharacterized protein (DUF697 family)